jgi:hypothetical protein
MFLEALLALTPLDFDHLARAVQVESARNTQDELCVAVSILNRVRSPHFPNTVANVVYAPGQYEGFLKRRPSADSRLVKRLQNVTAMQKAYNIIGDRTDFKGQSQLRYRVTSEDPMCHHRGNFFHYHWQS